MDIDEPLDQLFEIAGDTLWFQDITYPIQGIPATEYKVLYKGMDTVYEIEKQTVLFRVASDVVLTEIIAEGMKFYIDKQKLKYWFIVDDTPIPDITGISKLRVSLVAVESA